MGANIGTSVTNTIVAHAHMINREEFMNGMRGATVHDAFNFLAVCTLLPIEIITQAFGTGLLLWMSDSMASGLVGASASTFTSPVKVIVGPASKGFIKIDKNIIKGLAKGCIECTIKAKDIALKSAGNIGDKGCKDDSRKDKLKKSIKRCVPLAQWQQTYDDGRIVSGGFVKSMGDIGGSIFTLIVALIFLCLALYGIVRILHHLVLSSGRVESADGNETPFVKYTRKLFGINPYLSMFFGMALTIAVQSSSITTSAFVPLVALQIITVDDMLPITLGANIGTTCTGFLAAIVTEKKNAIQIALCHLWFNIIGIIIWFPVPLVRRVPLKIANLLAERTWWYRWFGTYYVLTFFVLFPILLFAFSFTIDLGVGGVILNIILDLLLLAGVLVATWKIDKLASLFRLRKNEEVEPDKKQESEVKVEENAKV